MPNTQPCPYCNRLGFIRVETVIAKGRAYRSYYCGACNRTWELSEDGTHETSTDVPDRSRSQDNRKN